VLDNPPELHGDARLRDDDMLEIRVDRVFYDKVRLLWQERRRLRRWVATGFVLFFILALVTPKRYESTVRIVPPQNSGGLAALAAMAGAKAGAGTGGDTLGALAASLVGGSTSGTLIMAIMNDRTVSDRMIDRFNLKEEYGLKYYEYARKELAKHVEVAEDRKSGIITITVNSRSPQEAHDMAQAYVEELSRAVIELSASSARRERIFLENRLKVLKQELDRSAVEFAAYASKNTALNIPEQAKATMTAAARLQAELIAAQSELEGLQQIYTDNNMRVRSLRARIGELKRQIDTSDTSAGTPGSLGNIIHQLPQIGVKWADLYRTATINEAVYEVLTKQYELSRVQEAKEVAPVSVVDAPDIPERKASPKRTYMVLGGTFFFFVLGSAVIISKDAWRKLDPTDPRKELITEMWDARPNALRWERLRFKRMKN
jgi:capsule polysaccharide export protein KpsE/RkpR